MTWWSKYGLIINWLELSPKAHSLNQLGSREMPVAMTVLLQYLHPVWLTFQDSMVDVQVLHDVREQLCCLRWSHYNGWHFVNASSEILVIKYRCEMHTVILNYAMRGKKSNFSKLTRYTIIWYSILGILSEIVVIILCYRPFWHQSNK